MTDDDRALQERLAALEAEVKADADAQQRRKEVALAKVREERARREEERDDLRRRQAEIVTKKRYDEEVDHSDLGGALELAGRANKVRNELARKPQKGDKSWLISGGVSLVLGPLGWLYAGSWREAVPASLIWILLAGLFSKILPTVLLMPVLMVAMPLSAIAGVVYALSYNRHGTRQRLWGDDKDKKQLKSGS